MSHPLLRLEDISCSYGDQIAVDKFSLELQQQQIAVLLGSSGCGKSTVLRAVAGLEPISAGKIFLNHKLVSSSKTTLAPERRNIGMVFQDYALFPHLNVEQNIVFGLHKKTKAVKQKKLQQLLDLCQLQNLHKRGIDELSGGQQQRVALARALAQEPQILLLDEPLSNLDSELRRHLAGELRAILKQQGTAAIWVTHDQEEAFAVGDKIAIMHKHRLQQWDTPYLIYHQPCNRFVANFVGQGQFISGKAISTTHLSTELGKLKCQQQTPLTSEQIMDVLIRPDDVIFDNNSQYRAAITDKTFMGASTLYQLKIDSTKISALVPSHHDVAIGDKIGISLRAPHVVTFAKEKP